MNKLLQDKINKANRSRKRSSCLLPETYLCMLNPFWQTFLWIAALIWGAMASLFANNIMSFTLPTKLTDIYDLSPNYYTLSFLFSAIFLMVCFAISR